MLLTKLHIPSSGAALTQPTTLFDKLNKRLKRKLILISASTCFGETKDVSDWISLNKIPTAWFSIDGKDNKVIDFLNFIISGIQKYRKI